MKPHRLLHFCNGRLTVIEYTHTYSHPGARTKADNKTHVAAPLTPDDTDDKTKCSKIRVATRL